MSTTKQEQDKNKKSYHTEATGTALVTVKEHQHEVDLKLYGSCFW